MLQNIYLIYFVSRLYINMEEYTVIQTVSGELLRVGNFNFLKQR